MNPPNPPQRIDPAATIRRIGEAQRIVITTHARSDGDAVGAVAGFQRVLLQQGKSVQVFLHEPIPERYQFITPWLNATRSSQSPRKRQEKDGKGDGEALSVWNPNRALKILSNADLLMIVDTCAESQLGEVVESIHAAPIHKLSIDHHLTRDPVVDEILLDENAGACCQILTQLCDQAGWRMDAEAASLFFLGLATDTGWFRFSNAGPAVFTTAARLIDAGAAPTQLYERLYLNDPEPRSRLVGAVLSSYELLADGRLAVIRLTQAMLARCGATHRMTEEIINEPQRVGSVIACVLLAEPEDEGPIRVSLRSRRDIDVSTIAQRFGGGGHARAAGARIPGSLDAVYAQVVPMMIQAVGTVGDPPTDEFANR